MFEMYEALPVMGGLLTELVVSRLMGRQLRWAAMITLSVLIGIAAATMDSSGGSGLSASTRKFVGSLCKLR